MRSPLDLSRENEELQVVLASGIFDRSPKLAQLLSYVCVKYFEGEADQIKEYSVAVDGLGRPADFDPKRDSIIRVQFHRLRERLNEYYANDGASHGVHIVIPPGRYAPNFVHQAGAASKSQAAGETSREEFAAPVVRPAGTPAVPTNQLLLGVSLRRVFWATAILVAFYLGWFLVGPRSEPQQVARASVLIQPSPGDTTRILAGLPQGTYTDGQGHEWLSDRYFQGGTVTTMTNHPIWGTHEARLFQSPREGQFSYDIPAKPGSYELRLYFAETYFGESNPAGFGGEGSRSFGIAVNGTTIRPKLSVAGEAGVNVSDTKVYRDISPAKDGFVHLAFSKIENEPFVNAIELTPGVPGKLSPIRLIAQMRTYTDSDGRVWTPDRLAIGGQLVARTPDLKGAEDPQIYTGERFGNFSYTIPVTPGKYTVILHMSERWLGPGEVRGGPGVGERLFDILCNGVALEQKFDIFAHADGSERALTRTYRDVEPNYQGNIVLSFLPWKNYAALNALEIIDESK
jgi:hypothetical protein